MGKWWSLVAICAGTFMLMVDITIVTVALPDMAHGLHTTFTDLQWVIDLYALVLGALVLTAGAIADRAGRRRVYLIGLVLFAAASLTCGLAPNPGVLIAARGVQGVGAAAMLATTMALVSSGYSGRDRGVAFGIWGAVTGAAAAAGPILGGLLTTHLGWRWIFLVNIPVSVLAVALTLVTVTESRNPRPRGVDPAGMLTFTVAAGALTYTLIRGNWTSGRTLGLLAVTVVATAVFVVVELRREHPMLDLRLFRNGPFTAMLVAGALLSAAAWASMVYLSLWLQTVLGRSAIETGLIFLPCSLAAFVTSGLIGRVLHTASPRRLIGTGLLLIAVGALAQGVVRTGSGWAVVLPGLAVVGVGAGLSVASLSSAAMAAVPGERAGMAAGAVNTFRQLGYAFGVAVLGEVFRGGLGHAAGSRLAGTLEQGGAGAALARSPALAPVIHRAFADGLDLTFAVAAALGLVASAAVFTLVRRPAARAGAEPAAHEQVDCGYK